ncbi:acyl-CoA mutase large subunit family protein [bacterium]|nr:acyl-CoA mutase large subunit family protein [bacterium]
MAQPTKEAPLLEDFSVPGLDAWREEVVRLLRGIPFEKKMLTPTPEGITLRGMYTRQDLQDISGLDTMPGDKPFRRGTRSIGHRDGGWQIAQALPFPTVEDLNVALRHDLQRGQNAINLILDVATQNGLDPDHAEVGQVGKGGTSIASVKGLSRALSGIDLEQTVLHVEAGIAALPMAALVVALMKSRGNDIGKWHGSAGMDPLAGLLEYGSIPIPIKWAYGELSILTQWAVENTPGLKTISIYGHPYRDAGADAATELAAAMSTAVEALYQMETRNIPVEVSAGRVLFGFTTGNDFFMEIAKLRAARIMWSRIVEAAGGSETAARSVHIHARTSTHRLTTLDPYTNMLRGTTEAFAAVLGGCDSLHVAPFDAALTQVPSDLARRIARNTQLILKEETHAAAVIDPAGGSYYIEALTNELAEAAWKKFQQLEEDGGVLAVIKQGKLQREIEDLNKKRTADLGTRKDVLVGVNRYPNSSEKLADPTEVNLKAIHAQRAETMQKLRTSSSHQQEMKVMEKLQVIVNSDTDFKFDAIVEAAANGATIGEFTSSLRTAHCDCEEVHTLKKIRAAEPFEALRRSVADWQSDTKPAVFLANVGPFAEYMPRLDFIRSFYEVGGFRVQSEDWYQDAAAAIAAAKETGAPVVVVVGLDETYETAVPEIGAAFTNDAKVTVHVAGYPKDRLDEYKSAGVDEFIHIKSDIYATLNALATRLGVQS